MKKSVLILILFMGLIACCTKKQIVICDHRLLNGLMLDSLMNQYFLQENVENSAFFCIGVSISNDSLKLNILPILQKFDAPSSKPLSVFIFKNKKIFVFDKFADYLPNEKKSKTIKMYNNMVDALPVYFDTHDKIYPIWNISLKNNVCKIKISNHSLSLNPNIKFKPPTFNPRSRNATTR